MTDSKIRHLNDAIAKAVRSVAAESDCKAELAKRLGYSPFKVTDGLNDSTLR